MSTDFGTTYHEDQAYQAALKRAEALQGYYIHLLVFAVINAGLFLINLLTRGEDGSWWFVWPLALWGIAVVINTLVVFAGVFTEGWKERKAGELYRRSRQHA
ncbi:MAG TPA: 2TM domain-containing protein [Actinomycetota bacterium]|nr:2TM domain-containing protein [Actinomycetota bacterium]